MLIEVVIWYGAQQRPRSPCAWAMGRHAKSIPYAEAGIWGRDPARGWMGVPRAGGKGGRELTADGGLFLFTRKPDGGAGDATCDGHSGDDGFGLTGC